MSVDSSFEVQGLDRLLTKLTKLGADSQTLYANAGKRAMHDRVRGPCVLKCPVGVSGDLRASYKIDDDPDTGLRVKIVSPGESDVIFGSNLKYGYWVEYGSSPHKQLAGHEEFLQSITEWAAKKGIEDVDALIQHIRAHGTKAHPHLRPAWDEGKGKLTADIARDLRKNLREYAK